MSTYVNTDVQTRTQTQTSTYMHVLIRAYIHTLSDLQTNTFRGPLVVFAGREQGQESGGGREGEGSRYSLSWWMEWYATWLCAGQGEEGGRGSRHLRPPWSTRQSRLSQTTSTWSLSLPHTHCVPSTQFSDRCIIPRTPGISNELQRLVMLWHVAQHCGGYHHLQLHW